MVEGEHVKTVRAHVHKFLHRGLEEHKDLRDKLTESKSVAAFREVALEMKARRCEVAKGAKLGWYYRYWKPKEERVVGETGHTELEFESHMKIENDKNEQRKRDQADRNAVAAEEANGGVVAIPAGMFDTNDEFY